jgi:hypothetical protein
MDRFSPYEYLAFLLPGGLLLLAVSVVFEGWPPPDPGAGLLVILIGLAFVVGHAVASVASWLEPVAWGHLPGQRPNPFWGTIGKRGQYSETDRSQVEQDFRDRLGATGDLPAIYALGYTKLQQLKLDAHLQVLNQQIGFYRNTATACLLAILLELSTGVFAVGTPVGSRVALYGAGLALFATRYRRFWRYFTDAVIRGVRLLEQKAADDDRVSEQQT